MKLRAFLKRVHPCVELRMKYDGNSEEITPTREAEQFCEDGYLETEFEVITFYPEYYPELDCTGITVIIK